MGTALNTTIINAIRANTVAAIGTVATGLLQLQYIYAPKISTEPDGTPVAILGNASNEMGEFALTSLPLASIKFFPCIIQKEDGCALSQGLVLPTELLTDTTWTEADEEYVCVALPNIFFIYFGQDPPMGRISSDATKAAFGLLGPGYATWLATAVVASELDEDMDKVFDRGEVAHGNSFETFANVYFTNKKSTVWLRR
jgi:hypothetical protein